MKKLLLILLCLPMIGFGQSYTHKMDSIMSYENNVLQTKHEFTYDANNNNILCLSYRDSISILELEGKIENTYDINNNLILMERYDWDDILSVWEGYDKYEYTYDANNNLILKERYDWDVTFWEIDDRVEYTYDVNNNLILRERYVWDNILSVWEEVQKEEYTYDVNNNLILVEAFEWDDILSTFLTSSKQEYVYDTNGNMITYTTYIWDNGSWVYDLSSSYTYDLSLLTDNIAYPFSRNEFISEFEKIYYNPISTSSYDGYYTFHYSPIAVTGIINLNVNLREVKNVIDFLGRKTKPQPNTPFIEIYDDGTVEKRIVIE